MTTYRLIFFFRRIDVESNKIIKNKEIQVNFFYIKMVYSLDTNALKEN